MDISTINPIVGLLASQPKPMIWGLPPTKMYIYIYTYTFTYYQYAYYVINAIHIFGIIGIIQCTIEYATYMIYVIHV